MSKPQYVVRESCAKMPANCWGRYVHIAVMEVEEGYIPYAISDHPKQVRRIVAVWRNQYVGTTDRCARNKALAAAHALADSLSTTGDCAADFSEKD